MLALRRLRLPGFQISRQSGLSRTTVSRILRRHGPAKLSALEPAKPVVRYQRDHPGELLHFDIKKLGRIVRPSRRVTDNRRDRVAGAGREYVHVAIDDASRLRPDPRMGLRRHLLKLPPTTAPSISIPAPSLLRP